MYNRTTVLQDNCSRGNTINLKEIIKWGNNNVVESSQNRGSWKQSCTKPISRTKEAALVLRWIRKYLPSSAFPMSKFRVASGPGITGSTAVDTPHTSLPVQYVTLTNSRNS
ncbi:hypothetical protein J6590_077153 [Homalodisca vitripennis]|nr:hypothetical protein J6590_077153 [Homalodisca vitripennis]